VISAEQAAAGTRRAGNPGTAGVVLVPVGFVATILGYMLGHTTILVGWKGGNASQLNGICTSSIGQFSQALDAHARSACAQVALYEQVSGWLIVAGVLAMAAGTVYEIMQRRSRAVA
jgi:hypothetical protein